MNVAAAPRWLPLAPWVFLLIWSAGYPIAKSALDHTGPLNLLAWRFLCSTLVLLPVILWLRPPLPSLLAVRDILIVATFVQLVHFGMVYGGMALGASPNIMALFAASQPILITLGGCLILWRAPAFRVWLGLTLGIGGAAWVIGMRGDVSGDAVLGAVMGFVAVVGLSVGATYDKHTRPICHPLLVYGIQYAYASCVTVPIAAVTEGIDVVWTPQFLLALAYIVIVNSLFGIFLLLTMVRFGKIARVTSVMFLVPGVAAIVAWLLIDQVLPLVAWPGIAAAMLGVLLVLYAPAKE